MHSRPALASVLVLWACSGSQAGSAGALAGAAGSVRTEGAAGSGGGGGAIGAAGRSGGTTAGGPSYLYPVRQGPTGARYLVDQNGTPFFWSGDTAWSLIAQLNDADTNLYLDDRQAKGFNVLLVNLLEHRFSTNAPANLAGDPPFTGAPFITPNEPYFAHADRTIDAAAQRGIMVLLDVLYLGYSCGDEGWCGEVRAASSASMTSWGEYVGNRYRARPNLVYVVGGDTDPTDVQSQVTAVVNGILSTDTTHLMTAHNQAESFAISPWPNEPWLTINSVYSYSNTLYEPAQTAYQVAPVMPFFELESAYENEHDSTPQSLRAQAYWSVLGGAMGHTFGNCPIWLFGASSWCGITDWKGQLNGAGSVSMMRLGRVMRSRAWHKLVPDWAHTVVTAGYGTWGDPGYATAARTTDGSTIMVYLPTARAVTIDLTTLSGTAGNCWWYDPASGAATLAGTYPTTGSRQFTPPMAGDWVLVLDDASQTLSAPGT